MIRKVLNRANAKRVISFIACLSILALALPCNCMADVPTEPVKSEHPCHSSHSDHSDTDKRSHNNGNCCCSDSLNLLTPNIAAEAIGASSYSLQKQWIGLFYSLSNPFENWNQLELIRGSPPTSIKLVTPLSTFLAVIQRWLI